MKRRIDIVSLLIVFVCISCGKGNLDDGIRQDGVLLDIKESILSAETKAPILPDSYGDSQTFPKGATYGLFICDHHNGEGENPYKEHAYLYNNICATKSNSGTAWMYNYSGSTSTFPSLFLLGKKDESDESVHADIFAYAPYIRDVVSPEHIPFKVSDQADMMYAVQNRTAGNKDIDPMGPERTRPVYLTFVHTLALLEFNFEVKNELINHPEENKYANGYTLKKITISKTSTADAPLYTTGELNAVTGELVNLTEAESIAVSYSSYATNGQSKIKAHLLLVPTQPDDEEFVFSFVFDGVTLNTVFNLKKEHLRHGESDTYGFQAGYEYKFNFVIDNYIHFKDVEFGEWTTVEEPVYEIHI